MVHVAYNIQSNKAPDNVSGWTQCNVARVGCRAIRRGVSGMIAVITCVWMLGCVKTAECDEHVSCGRGEVCYQHQCMVRCEQSAQCAEGEVCASCQGNRQNPQGLCHGVRGGACVSADLGQ